MYKTMRLAKFTIIDYIILYNTNIELLIANIKNKL